MLSQRLVWLIYHTRLDEKVKIWFNGVKGVINLSWYTHHKALSNTEEINSGSLRSHLSLWTCLKYGPEGCLPLQRYQFVFPFSMAIKVICHIPGLYKEALNVTPKAKRPWCVQHYVCPWAFVAPAGEDDSCFPSFADVLSLLQALNKPPGNCWIDDVWQSAKEARQLISGQAAGCHWLSHGIRHSTYIYILVGRTCELMDDGYLLLLIFMGYRISIDKTRWIQPKDNREENGSTSGPGSSCHEKSKLGMDKILISQCARKFDYLY